MQIDGLEAFEQIGEGGFGTVYRATDPQHGRKVAVKLLRDAPDEAGRRRFDRERRAMGTLSGHPNIAVVHSSGVDPDGRLYLVMEHLPGGSMADRLEAGPMDPAAVVDVGRGLADALALAHEQGVLHLDVKPENVLLSDFGAAKLVDFGIAAFVNDGFTTTIRATPAYAAPEVLEGQPPGPAADVYGLGATLYALLMGRAPYGGSETGALSVIRAVATDDVPRVDRADVSTELAGLLEACMAKSAADRPSSMAEVRDRLAAISPTAAGAAPRSAAPATVTMAGGSFPATSTTGTPPHGARTGEPVTALDEPSASTPSGPGRALVLGVVIVLALVAAVALWAASRGDDTSADGSDETATTETTETSGSDTTATTSTTAPTTTVPATTAAPTTQAAAPTTAPLPTVPLPPEGPTASNAFWSTDVQNNQAVDDTVTLPIGAPSLCLNWAYTDLPVGASFAVRWSVDGQPVRRYDATGENRGNVAGTFWACANDFDNGLGAGRYEASWVVDGDRVFTHSFRVGPQRGTTVFVENDSGAPICAVHLDVAGASSVGIDRLPGPIPDGQSFPIGVSAGDWSIRVVDCDRRIVLQQVVDADEDVTVVVG